MREKTKEQTKELTELAIDPVFLFIAINCTDPLEYPSGFITKFHWELGEIE